MWIHSAAVVICCLPALLYLKLLLKQLHSLAETLIPHQTIYRLSELSLSYWPVGLVKECHAVVAVAG
jgi:hypothetical protein